MPEQRKPTQEDMTYHFILEGYTHSHFQYIHGMISYEQLMVAYNKLLSCYGTAHAVDNKETSSG